ncbi:hypothetical protein PGTUg99_000237 [Puccinia graminis f. sp. tritici]|uniref:FHA domain-containing protein n=1 Tax=Puccinia graminis f. sp. tritici TaxID=56615 RepID=A0A5B0N3P1_PUCGR|nr:hypothetical protein PGTUg99_000237 [Puccinia graminis f. sp. tritici]
MAYQTFSLRLVPHLDATRSLHFEPIERKLNSSSSLKLGRFTDRGGGTTNTTNGETRIAFKSKVVSRGHADIFTDPSGSFFIKDTKSSSGTFLNHIRLSAPGVESRPFPLRDGDVLQLGVDYQGGTEEIYRCVKMRVELNRGWQRSANVFNQQALAQLRTLGVKGATHPPPANNPTNSAALKDGSSSKNLNKASSTDPALAVDLPKAVSDCCICLFGVTVCQALFIAPCSHTYHYKCIRPLLQMHHPGFSCPLCRTFADLEADVETEEEEEQQQQPEPDPSGGGVIGQVASVEHHLHDSPPAVSTPQHRQIETIDSALLAQSDRRTMDHHDNSLVDHTVVHPSSASTITTTTTNPSRTIDRAHTMVMSSEMEAVYRDHLASLGGSVPSTLDPALQVPAQVLSASSSVDHHSHHHHHHQQHSQLVQSPRSFDHHLSRPQSVLESETVDSEETPPPPVPVPSSTTPVFSSLHPASGNHHPLLADPGSSSPRFMGSTKTNPTLKSSPTIPFLPRHDLLPLPPIPSVPLPPPPPPPSSMEAETENNVGNRIPPASQLKEEEQEQEEEEHPQSSSSSSDRSRLATHVQSVLVQDHHPLTPP